MLLYANGTLPIIQNLNGFLGIYGIGYIPGLLFTSFVYLSIMNAINLTDGIDGYLAIFSIFFFTSLLYNFDVKKNIFYHHPEKYIEALQDGFPIIKNNLFSKKFMKSHRLHRDKQIDSFISPEILSILGNLQ